MSSPLAKVIRAAHRAASRVQGGEILYRRGDNSVTITATFGRSQMLVETAEAVRTLHTDRDFLFPAADLVLGGQAAKPQKGDLIEAGAETYEVLPLDGEQCFRRPDPAGTMIRVFTKRID